MHVKARCVYSADLVFCFIDLLCGQKVIIFLLALFPVCHVIAAQTLSYDQAERDVLSQSFSSQASQVLQQAADLDAQAVRGLGLPRIDLNARAYRFHTEVDVPLDSFKRGVENSLNNSLDQQLNNWGALPEPIGERIREGAANIIQDGLSTVPNSTNLSLEDGQVRSSVSMVLPIYTGGLIQSTKEIANIESKRAELTHQQQEDIQRFEIIQAYFSVQLNQQLVSASQFNFKAMQQHTENALKLEQQGFINKGQRMIFEVARNNAQRLAQNASTSLQNSQFRLNNLLRTPNNAILSTPLFINTENTQALNSLMQSYPESSSLVRKLKLDTELAGQAVRVQEAAKKPTLFAFGEYALDSKENWIVGVAARYNLFSGIDHRKKIQSAELKRYATQLASARTRQEIENMIYTSYNEMSTAQKTHALLQQNKQAAIENLRIQTLSFQEDMGTATQVIDAQNALSALQAETALNAYKYILSLATLLQSHGSISSFKSYAHQPSTDFLR